jgi:thiamine-phosphate pyrophosphorylase
MKPIADCYLYGFIDTAFLDGRNPAYIASELCDGGVDIIQLRAKNHSPEAVRHMAAMIQPVTVHHGVPLVINDHLEVALQLNTDYCHLGQEDFFNPGHSHVDEIVPPGNPLQIGLSSHGPEQALRALASDAAYLGVGPVFSTTTKPEARAVTLDYVRWAHDHITIPWFAIGGINLDNLDQVLEAGATRICVVSAILNAPSIRKACEAFKNKLNTSK